MFGNVSNKSRAALVGILIIAAYSMLAYDVTKNAALGVIADFISGSAVVFIALLMFPVFNSGRNKVLNWAYLSSKVLEGILMIIGGAFILSPALISFRSVIYQSIHIYFFIAGALLFYILFYRTRIIPKFISLWGIFASVLLLIITIIKLFGIKTGILDILLLPMILNEVFLAVWLIIRGFDKNFIKEL